MSRGKYEKKQTSFPKYPLNMPNYAFYYKDDIKMVWKVEVYVGAETCIIGVKVLLQIESFPNPPKKTLRYGNTSLNTKNL